MEHDGTHPCASQVVPPEEVQPGALLSREGLVDELLERIGFGRGRATVDVVPGANFVQNLFRFLLAPVQEEPSWGLWRKWHQSKQKNGWDELHGCGDDPPFICRLICISARHAGAPEVAEAGQEHERAGQNTPRCGGRDLGVVGRADVLDEADSKVRNDATNRKLGPVVGCQFDYG